MQNMSLQKLRDLFVCEITAFFAVYQTQNGNSAIAFKTLRLH